MNHVLVTGAGGFIGGHLVRRLREDGVGGSGPSTASPTTSGTRSSTTSRTSTPTCSCSTPAARPPTASTRCSTWRPTWAAWASSRTTRPCACCRCSSRRTCSWPPARPASSASSTRRRPACTRPRSRCRPRSSRWPRPTPTRPCPRTATAGRSCSASGWPATSSRTSASQTRVARYHNVYGPDGTWDGGREKAPAAICRKVATAELSGDHTIEIWGDGEQTRSFTYIDDCLEGTLRLTASDVAEPLNIGSDQLVTINQLVDIVEDIAGVRLERNYKLDAPQGVRGRNSDNTLHPRAARLGAVDQPRGRPRRHLRLGPRPGGRRPARLTSMSAQVSRSRRTRTGDDGAMGRVRHRPRAADRRHDQR